MRVELKGVEFRIMPNKEILSDAPYYLKDFITYMETIKGKSSKTVDEYFLDLRTFLRYMLVLKKQASLENFDEIPIRDIPIGFIQEITLHDLYEYLSYTLRERLNNANSRARKVSSLKSFFKYLMNKAKLISFNPAAELDSPKIPKTLPKYLSLDESKQLLENIDGTHKYRDYAMITLFLNCGLRLSELASINLKDIREDKLTVFGKGSKERTVYLNQACMKAIREYLENERPKDNLKVPDKDALFLSRLNKRISVKTIQYVVKKHLEAAGLDTNKYSVHKLRHTAATLMYRHGHVDVRVLQEILGHTNLSTTQIYTHLDDEQLRNASERNPLADL